MKRLTLILVVVSFSLITAYAAFYIHLSYKGKNSPHTYTTVVVSYGSEAISFFKEGLPGPYEEGDKLNFYFNSLTGEARYTLPDEINNFEVVRGEIEVIETHFFKRKATSLPKEKLIK